MASTWEEPDSCSLGFTSDIIDVDLTDDPLDEDEQTVLLLRDSGVPEDEKTRLLDERSLLDVCEECGAHCDDRNSILCQLCREMQGKWAEGDECEAVWFEDEVFYLARVLSVHDEGLRCDVEFVEYGNIQKDTPVRFLRDLTPLEELEKCGLVMREGEAEFSAYDMSEADWEETVSNFFEHIKVIDCEVEDEVHKYVFDGYSAVSLLLVEGMCPNVKNRVDALKVCERMLSEEIILHMSDSEEGSFFTDAVVLYRLNTNHAMAPEIQQLNLPMVRKATVALLKQYLEEELEREDASLIERDDEEEDLDEDLEEEDSSGYDEQEQEIYEEQEEEEEAAVEREDEEEQDTALQEQRQKELQREAAKYRGRKLPQKADEEDEFADFTMSEAAILGMAAHNDEEFWHNIGSLVQERKKTLLSQTTERRTQEEQHLRQLQERRKQSRSASVKRNAQKKVKALPVVPEKKKSEQNMLKHIPEDAGNPLSPRKLAEKAVQDAREKERRDRERFKAMAEEEEEIQKSASLRGPVRKVDVKEKLEQKPESPRKVLPSPPATKSSPRKAADTSPRRKEEERKGEQSIPTKEASSSSSPRRDLPSPKRAAPPPSAVPALKLGGGMNISSPVVASKGSPMVRKMHQPNPSSPPLGSSTPTLPKQKAVPVLENSSNRILPAPKRLEDKGARVSPPRSPPSKSPVNVKPAPLRHNMDGPSISSPLVVKKSPTPSRPPVTSSVKSPRPKMAPSQPPSSQPPSSQPPSSQPPSKPSQIHHSMPVIPSVQKKPDKRAANKGAKKSVSPPSSGYATLSRGSRSNNSSPASSPRTLYHTQRSSKRVSPQTSPRQQSGSANNSPPTSPGRVPPSVPPPNYPSKRAPLPFPKKGALPAHLSKAPRTHSAQFPPLAKLADVQHLGVGSPALSGRGRPVPTQTTTATKIVTPSPSAPPYLGIAVVSKSFTAQREEQLSVVQGATVMVLAKPTPSWIVIVSVSFFLISS